MRTRYFAALMCLLMTACNSPSNNSSSENSETKTESLPIAQFDELNQSFDQAMKKFSAAYRDASKEERPAIYENLYPKNDKYAAQFMALAKENPGTEVACNSLLWIAQRGDEGLSEEAYATLWEDHIESENLRDLWIGLVYATPSQKNLDRINQLLEKNPHDSVKAAATYALAQLLGRIRSMKKSGDQEEFVANCDVSDARIELLYNQIISQYPDVKFRAGSKQTFSSMAEGALFEIHNLAIGKQAPEIEGKDLDGQEFKLSDYRGKVVLLDFWGDW
ncbi:MAG: TlpA family protein disulfide reductase [Mariniblastus sp.]